MLYFSSSPFLSSSGKSASILLRAKSQISIFSVSWSSSSCAGLISSAASPASPLPSPSRTSFVSSSGLPPLSLFGSVSGVLSTSCLATPGSCGSSICTISIFCNHESGLDSKSGTTSISKQIDTIPLGAIGSVMRKFNSPCSTEIHPASRLASDATKLSPSPYRFCN